MSDGLRGRRVGVTRSRSQASELSRLLAEAGAVPVELHCLEFADPTDWTPFDAAFADLGRFDGVLFTSTNAVRRTLARIGGTLPPGLRIAAVGGATMAVCAELGVAVDVVPERYLSEGLLEVILTDGVAGTRWLLPRAEVAREVLPEGLRAAGATVDVVAAYRTVPPADPGPIRRALELGLDAVLFASGSSVRHLRGAVGEASWPQALDGVAVGTIGPITSAAVREHGLSVEVEASTASMPALTAALAAWWGRGAP